MPLIFRSNDASDMNVTYQFTMEGDGGGQWSMRIGEGRADTAEGAADPHDCEIKTKPALWMDLASGDLSPPIAIMTRKVKLGGNVGLAMKLSGLFGNTG
jgi:putative sterol carrier protein